MIRRHGRFVGSGYLPSRREIAEQCRMIREVGGWTDDSGRLHGPWEDWQFRQRGPVIQEYDTAPVSVREFVGAVEEAGLDGDGED